MENKDVLYNSEMSTNDLPSVRIRKLQDWFKQLDLLILDNVIENFPVRQMRIRLGAILKKLPQCDA